MINFACVQLNTLIGGRTTYLFLIPFLNPLAQLHKLVLSQLYIKNKEGIKIFRFEIRVNGQEFFNTASD